MTRGAWFTLWAGRASFASAGVVAEQAARLLRNMILARLLAPDEFGTAVALGVVLGAVEMACDISAEKYVVLRGGDGARAARDAAHTLQLARGLLMAAALVLLSAPMAVLMAVPQAAPGIAALALYPLIRGFAHLEIKQVQHEYRFAADAVASCASHGLALAVGATAAVALADHRAIIISLLAEALLYTMLSHRLAASPWRIGLEGGALRAALAFSLPLMANGVGLAAMAQADRMLVSNRFGVEALALYAIVLSVTVALGAPLHRVLFSLGFSLRLRAAGGVGEARAALRIAWLCCLAGLGFAGGIGLVLDGLVPLLFGPAYAVTPWMHVLAVGVAFMRLARVANTVLLLAEGRSRALALGNLCGLFGLGAGAVLCVVWPDPAAVLLGILLGDVVVEVVLRRQASAGAAGGAALRRQLAVLLALLAGLLLVQIGGVILGMLGWPAMMGLTLLLLAVPAAALAMPLRSH